MKHFIQFRTAIFALAITLTFSACETTILGEDKKVQTNQKTFDMDQFQENVEAGLGPQWVGYSYVINQNGQAARTGNFGLRHGPNDGNVQQSIAAPIYGASINKTITAVALLKLLDEYGNLTASEMLNANTGWDIGNRSNALGQGGYYICSRDIAKLLAYVNHTDQILTPNARKAMFDNFLGWSDGGLPENEPKGDFGTYYYKGGSFCNSSQNGSCTGMGVRNIIAVFPKNGVEIVIMANSRGGDMDNSGSLRAMVRNAYDDAWITN